MAKRASQTSPHPVDNVLAAIHVLTNQIGRIYLKKLESEFGFSNAEWRVMLTLHDISNSTAADITAQWAMDKMAISRAIRRLEERGWITREVNPDDRRSLVLSLTQAGQEKYAEVLPTANAIYHDIMSVLSREELGRLRGALGGLIDHTATLVDL
jgi:DNA-binding MarR family transcriptional regulator